MRMAYRFTNNQNAMMDELLLPEYQSLSMQLTSSYVNISLPPEELAVLMENLPQNLDERRKGVVMAAYSLVGKVNYFWGGKSTVIGWDSRWGDAHKGDLGGQLLIGNCPLFWIAPAMYLGLLQRGGNPGRNELDRARDE